MSTAWHVLSLTFIAGLVSQNSLGLLDLQLCLFGFAGLWGNRLHVEGSEWGNAARCVCVCNAYTWRAPVEAGIRNAWIMQHTQMLCECCVSIGRCDRCCSLCPGVSAEIFNLSLPKLHRSAMDSFVYVHSSRFYRHDSIVGSMSLHKIKYVRHILLVCGC